MYTIADLEWLTLEITASRRMDVLAALISPQRAAELEDLAARRRPGQLIKTGEVALSQSATEIAQRVLACGGDPDTLRILAAGSPFAEVYKDLARNPATPPETLVELTRSSEDLVAMAATGNGSLPVEELETIGVMGSVAARLGALTHPRAPRWLIDHAATDPSPWLRAQVAANPDLSPPLLAALAGDDDATVRAATARNVRLPAPLLSRLATGDPDVWVRAAAAANPAVTADILLRLAGDDDTVVRSAAATSTALTAEVAAALVDDPDYRVQGHLAANPHCPPAVLAALARSRRPVHVRGAVAKNPACPPAVLQRLAADRSAQVRWYAAWER